VSHGTKPVLQTLANLQSLSVHGGISEEYAHSEIVRPVYYQLSLRVSPSFCD
jgi:hypothetical protein